LGPVYVGSGSILSALFSQSKQADINVGFHIGILKPKKTAPTIIKVLDEEEQ